MLKPILDRRSIRRYTDEPVSDAAVEQILEAARLAPSGSNTQPWRFTVVRDARTRAAIAEVSHRQKWMNTAPMHIVCVADIRSRIAGYAEPPLDDDSPLAELKKAIRDTSIGVEHLVLEATALGLGTCWVAWFTQPEIRAVLDVPPYEYVVAVVTVGHAAESPAARQRLALEQIVRPERGGPGATAAGAGPPQDAGYTITDDRNSVDLAVVHDYLSRSSYWAAGRSLETVRRSVENSLCYSVFSPAGRQVGFARLVTDHATFAWLCDVFILEEHRGRGLAKRLMEAILARPDLASIKRIALRTRDAHGLYRQYGFGEITQVETWMERPGPAQPPGE
jgi:nitroreductase/GNAT superfamily N-acetyltransferase